MIDGFHDTKVSLAHDWLVAMRGGEWVLDRLCRMFGPTDLYVLVNDGRRRSEAIASCRIMTSPLQRFPAATGRLRRAYLPVLPWAVERLSVAPCDLLVSTSAAVMKSIIPPPGTPHLCYCHSPARYVWEQSADYRVGSGGVLRGLGLRVIGERFRRWDRATADRVTMFLANSRHTAARIARCYRRDAEVVPPPARTEFFTPDSAVEREDWFLVVSALEPYKRTDLAIEAANEGGFALKVVGRGTQAAALRRLAGPTVEMLDHVPDDMLRDLYRRARALVFPQVEDFGLVPVEAQATGCPVVAFAAGGALETVTADTGVFFTEQTVAAMVDAVRSMETKWFDPIRCRVNAERFSESVFDRTIARHARAALGHAPVVTVAPAADRVLAGKEPRDERTGERVEG